MLSNNWLIASQKHDTTADGLFTCYGNHRESKYRTILNFKNMSMEDASDEFAQVISLIQRPFIWGHAPVLDLHGDDETQPGAASVVRLDYRCNGDGDGKQGRPWPIPCCHDWSSNQRSSVRVVQCRWQQIHAQPASNFGLMRRVCEWVYRTKMIPLLSMPDASTHTRSANTHAPIWCTVTCKVWKLVWKIHTHARTHTHTYTHTHTHEHTQLQSQPIPSGTALTTCKSSKIIRGSSNYPPLISNNFTANIY